LSKQKAKIAPIWARAKASIIDLFIIGMPVFYISTYLVLGGKEAFLNNQLEIYLINLQTGKKLSLFHAILRQICFAFAGFSIIGLCLCFFRKDKLNLHDIITHSAAVQKAA